MGIVGRLEDPDDDRLADYVNLRGPAWRRVWERRRGIFVAEGEKVVTRLLATPGWRVRSVLVADDRWDRYRALASAAPDDVPIWRASQAVIDRVTGFNLHRGLLAAADRPAPVPWRQRVPPARTAAGGGGRQRPGEPRFAVPFRRRARGRCAPDQPRHLRSPLPAHGAGVDGGDLPPALRRAGALAVGPDRAGRPRLVGGGADAGAEAAEPLEGAAAEALRGRERVAVLVGSEGPGLSDGCVGSGDRAGTGADGRRSGLAQRGRGRGHRAPRAPPTAMRPVDISRRRHPSRRHRLAVTPTAVLRSVGLLDVHDLGAVAAGEPGREVHAHPARGAGRQGRQEDLVEVTAGQDRCDGRQRVGVADLPGR